MTGVSLSRVFLTVCLCLQPLAQGMIQATPNDALVAKKEAAVASIENHRSELVWRTMRRNPHLVRGLKAAGFTGGWLEPDAGER